jgi:virginiamycin B lyase
VLVGIVLLWASGGVAGRALALTFKEFPVSTPIGVPYSLDNSAAITTGPDGALWFIEKPNQIGRITTAGVITQFPVPTGSLELLGLTAGPDGALWFTERASFTQPTAGKIGRITTAGVVTEFPADGDPVDITTGPDGASGNGAMC